MDGLDIVQLIPFVIGLVVSAITLRKYRLISYNGRLIPGSEADERIMTSGVEIGGVAIFPILLIAMCLSLGIPHYIGMMEWSYDNINMTLLSEEKVLPSALRIMQVIAACAILYSVGLKNDMNGVGMRAKFIALLATACMFPLSGLWIQDIDGLFGIERLSAYVGVPLTIMMTMFITEMVSIMDDVDGLGAGLFFILVAVFSALCVQYEFVLGSIVSMAALGVVLPFVSLKSFNKGWKKTVLGDAGSYVLGYILSYLALAIFRQGGHSMPEGMQMIVLGTLMFPSIDILRVLRQRIREQRGILTPDRNQIQHRLRRTGLSPMLVPVVIVMIIVAFAMLNSWWVISGHRHFNTLLLIDIVILVAIQMLIGFAISRNETKHNMEKWEMAYGREAWEADIPVEAIKQKHQNFGTMGLPTHVILGDELDFIPDGMNAIERETKRIIDFIVAACLIVLFSPLFLLSYILIKMDDGGPAIYSQERIGRFGRAFRIHKFRSMRLDAEKYGPALSHGGGDDDPRLTKVGKFLRAHHLDELPQLWDVLRGDMAFIGPRPERKFFIDQIMEHDPRYSFLYQIRPGVTSYATLYNGYTDTMEKMLRRLSYDLFYLEHRSWWLDMKILWLTFISIVSGKKF